MVSVNSILADEAISHSVDLAHYSNNVVNRIIATLNRADRELFAELTDALDYLPIASFTIRRLEELLASVRRLNVEAYAQVQRELTAELRAFVIAETAYQESLIRAVVPPPVVPMVVSISAEQVVTAALARPFQGALLSQWAKSIEADRLNRIRKAVTIGYTNGQPISDILRALRGTVAKGRADGFFEADRRGLRAVVQTAIGHMAASTRTDFDDANKDLIKGYVWTSTIDNKTSSPCRIRDGKRYDARHQPVGHSVPWLAGPGKLHWSCRSTEVRVLKSLRELGLNVDDFKSTTRASMDGQIPAETTYAQWLEKQPLYRQNEILGPTRAQLLRQGGVKPDDFYSVKGKYLTLDELRQRNAEAFKRAGI